MAPRGVSCVIEEKDANMIRMYQTLSILVLVVTVSVIATPATAADHTPDGTVAMQSTSIAIGIGIDWGKGTLTFKGKHYPFQVGGLQAVGVGVATEHAEGSVYHLTEVSDFAGTYVAAEAAFAVAGGFGATTLRNQNGVVMHLRSVSQGVQLTLAAAGVKVKLE